MKMLKTLISIVLVITMCVTMMMPASAARVTYYLSDLKMAEASTADEAKALLTAEGYEILDKNLNPGGSKAVYLGYKKSTNVDDAITDIRVMNMNGGFNVSDYNSIIEDALEIYKKEVDNIRIAANEFAENYKAGKREAQIAYRQLNYYYVELEKGVKTYMGDYMLNFPEKNEGFTDILLKGNINILNNIKILLAMGVADGGDLIERIKAATADEAVYGNFEYHEDAKEFAGKIQQLKKILDDTYAEIDEIKADPELTEEEKELSLKFSQYTASQIVGFDYLLETIPCGESNYGEYFETNISVDYSLLYPFVAAMTPGQRAMAVSGQLHSVLIYNAVEMSDEELNEQFAETEEGFEPLSVYLGTDMDLLEGAIGVTSEALREEAATGKDWFACFTGNMAADITISSLFGIGGAALLGVSAHYLKNAIDFAKLTEEEAAIVSVNKELINVNKTIDTSDEYARTFYAKENTRLTNEINDIYAAHHVSAGTYILTSLGVAAGITMIALSIYSIVQIVNKYNPKYTQIPSNMVDAVSTANGSRFVNYKVVNALYKNGDKTAEKPGDTNGYDGNQWNAIYYTKSYEAGKCMTATPYVIDSAANFGKYTPVAQFGGKNCFDLNSFNRNESTENIFIAFGNSNTKKSAETSVPTVIGSAFTYGIVAVSGVAGLGLGMCIMALVKRKKVH